MAQAEAEFVQDALTLKNGHQLLVLIAIGDGNG
jgi:hypothetical protein